MLLLSMEKEYRRLLIQARVRNAQLEAQVLSLVKKVEGISATSPARTQPSAEKGMTP